MYIEEATKHTNSIGRERSILRNVVSIYLGAYATLGFFYFVNVKSPLEESK